MDTLGSLRSAIRAQHLADDALVLDRLKDGAAITEDLRAEARDRAIGLVERIRANDDPGLMEVFLAEYGLSTREGIALMCLAEALLRVPDAETIDALIEDKIAPSAWGSHLGKSSSSLVNASTWALMLTGKVLQDGTGMASALRGAVKRLGEPVIRTAVGRAMKELGAQFVLGETIDAAVARGRSRQKRGYTFSYDMLGEAAITAADADAYYHAYADAIARLAPQCTSDEIAANPGISIKLSALHPRYETTQRDRVMTELVARTSKLARQARAAGMGLNIDAEEADRLDLSLDVIEAVLRDPDLAGWDGFGVVVQAYGKRAGPVLDWLYALAETLDRRIMVRLVKGAYWDTEIKRAQVEGLSGFPVFSRKAATDVSYMCCARKLLGMTDRIYPQFATHNAHSVAAILEMADDPNSFEFQRLHGMGEALHDMVLVDCKTRCRIYAPVGAHRDLLAYLVRRLLENGANSSFVNQIVNEQVPPAKVAADPFLADTSPSPLVPLPPDLYGAERRNSAGWDLHDPDDLSRFDAERGAFRDHIWEAGPILAGSAQPQEPRTITNPAAPNDTVGTLRDASDADVETALDQARPWDAPAKDRAACLMRAADLYEQSSGAFFAILAREAGKSARDTISELREAVDFLRYYANRGIEQTQPAEGVFACISPWNFPLAIFTGQIAAALAAGNGVIAKPAETTSLTAHLATRLLLDAGVPAHALQLLPGTGSVVGAALSCDPRIAGLCFTGSTATAQRINRSMADTLSPTAPLIAETGGLNAMIVDSTALPQQAIRDIVTSAFQSAGQRCSALRLLYLQKDVAKPVLDMLYGAMDELTLGDPWDVSIDIGPVIDSTAQAKLRGYIEDARADGRVLRHVKPPKGGTFIGPAVVKVPGIDAMKEEIFGPILHVATFEADEIDAVVDAINASGYGLTFGMHSRIDDRVEQVASQLKAGNIYINRNQIGAIVGSQPFGGEGMSGTGPKAGGPAYVPRFTRADRRIEDPQPGSVADEAAVAAALAKAATVHALLSQTSLPGPTGESNRISEVGRGTVLCLGPTAAAARRQGEIARQNGCAAVLVAPGVSRSEGIDGVLPPEALERLSDFAAVACFGPDHLLRPIRQALARRDGAILPLFADGSMAARCRIERHICIDTTASGGNASLLAQAS